MLIARLIILILFCWVGQSHAVVFLGDRIQIKDDIQIVPSEGFDASIYRKELEHDLLVRERVEKVDDNQPRYLYAFDLANSGAQKEILVKVSGTIVDEIDLYDMTKMKWFILM